MKGKLKNTQKYPVGASVSYLTILKHMKVKNRQRVLCECVCGKKKEFELANIIPSKNRRYTQSCGCKRGELVGTKTKTHGMSKTKFYKHWRSMHDRLLPSYIDADSYVGIKICNGWRKFENFKEDMYESWEKHETEHGGRNTTLERIDVNGDYTKKNCCWATQAEQAVNKKNTLYMVHPNMTKTPLKTVCDNLGLKYATVRARIKRGYTAEQALNNGLWERANKHG